MEELSNIHVVAIAGFIIAFILGVVGNKTQFCTMGAISDWINFQNRGRLAACVLAMIVAIVGVQALELFNVVEIESSRYRVPTFTWLGSVLGGLMFGMGMTFAGGCGQRTLVRMGNGSLKSFFVFLVMGLSAYITIRGLLGAIRVNYIEPVVFDFSEMGVSDQGLPSVTAQLVGMAEAAWVPLLVIVLVVGLMLFWALRQKGLLGNTNNLLAGVTMGLAVVASWITTGWLGLDDFDPIPLESLSFIAPSGNALMYLMTYTGATISFGVVTVAGVVVGSFVYGLLSKTIRLEAFAQPGDMLAHLVGAVLMGVGGVLALGCTMGQGVSGVSTLAIGSFVSTAFIVLGCAIALRAQYHRYSDMGWLKAFGVGLIDIVLARRDD